ncbi:hypothetical protein [Myroides injenensis]|uniref:hypothetical protein n=1 Tax=Myroides injenensis TaxID=1183151 RepID=UPI00028960F1|nr:hypothetical protein [Myroides injenensis]
MIKYFKGWTPVRWIRLGLGVLLLIQSFYAQLWILAIPAIYLFLQAFLGFGCNNNSCKY